MTRDVQCRELEYLRVLVDLRAKLGEPAGSFAVLPDVVGALAANAKKREEQNTAMWRWLSEISKAAGFVAKDDTPEEDSARALANEVRTTRCRCEDLENERAIFVADLSALRSVVRKLRAELRGVADEKENAARRKKGGGR